MTQEHVAIHEKSLKVDANQRAQFGHLYLFDNNNNYYYNNNPNMFTGNSNSKGYNFHPNYVPSRVLTPNYNARSFSNGGYNGNPN